MTHVSLNSQSLTLRVWLLWAPLTYNVTRHAHICLFFAPPSREYSSIEGSCFFSGRKRPLGCAVPSSWCSHFRRSQYSSLLRPPGVSFSRQHCLSSCPTTLAMPKVSGKDNKLKQSHGQHVSTAIFKAVKLTFKSVLFTKSQRRSIGRTLLCRMVFFAGKRLSPILRIIHVFLFVRNLYIT